MLMLEATLSPRTRAWLLRSSGQSPTPAATAEPTEPGAGPAPDGDGARVGPAGAEEGLDDLGASGTDEPGEPDHLARPHRRS